MRLPATTAQQKLREDSRQLCETLYQAFIDGKRVIISTTPYTVRTVQAQVAANTRHFWRERGFLIHTSQSSDKTMLRVWLEHGEAAKRTRRAA